MVQEQVVQSLSASIIPIISEITCTATVTKSTWLYCIVFCQGEDYLFPQKGHYNFWSTHAYGTKWVLLSARSENKDHLCFLCLAPLAWLLLTGRVGELCYCALEPIQHLDSVFLIHCISLHQLYSPLKQVRTEDSRASRTWESETGGH